MYAPTLSGRQSWPLWLFLVIYVTTLYLWQLGSARTFTGHECFVAEGAREMLATGDWIVPRIDGKPWLEKPPLPQWLVAVASAPTGVNEFVARLPSLLMGLMGVILITDLAMRWFGPLQGLLTGLIQATTLYTVTYARLAESDVYLWAIVVGCLWCFARNWVEVAAPEKRHWTGLAFLVLLGFTQLAKGPLFGAVLALLPCLSFLAVQRKFSAWRWFWRPVGLAIMVVLAVAWPAAILYQHPEAYDLWWQHTFGRVGGRTTLNPGPVWYYLSTLPWQIAPWTFVAAIGAWFSLRRAWSEGRPADRFLWLWLLVPLIVLSAVKAKHHHYLIHALPPCSFWAAEGFTWLILQGRDALRRWPWRVITLGGLGVVAAANGVFALVDPSHLPSSVRTFHQDVVVMIAMVLLACASLVLALLVRRPRLAFAITFAAVWCAYAYAHSHVYWKSDGYREESLLLARLGEQAPRDLPLLVFGLEPSRLLLYSPNRLEVYLDLDALKRRSKQIPEALILTSVGHEPQLRARGEPACVDKMPKGRGPKNDSFGQLAAFRMTWEKRRHGEEVAGQ